MRRLLVLPAALWLIGCESATPPDIDTTDTTPIVEESNIVSVTATPSTIVMASPGVMRSSIKILMKKNVADSTLTFTTTGPLTLGGLAKGASGYRVIEFSTSASGTGSIVVHLGDKADTIDITAVPLALRSASLSYGYACGLAADDTAWCWGGNYNGGLGLITPAACNGGACQYGGNNGNTTPLPATGDIKFKQIATTGYDCMVTYATGTCGRTCALTADGVAWCWGDGMGWVPRMVAPGYLFTTLSLRNGFTPFVETSVSCGLATDGKAYCFTPKATTPLAGGMALNALSVGRFHSCGVDPSGDGWCWGSNATGGLGIGSTDTSVHPNPERVTGSIKFKSIEVGNLSTCALDTAGKPYCWGLMTAAAGNTNSEPTACAGTPNCVTSPQALPGARTYTSISRSEFGTWMCGLAGDGTVDCWTAFNQSPVAVTAPAAFTSMNAHRGGTGCGVTAANVTYCWTTAGTATQFRP